MHKILYLQPTFDTHVPRNLRTANIIEYLKDDYSISVICLETYEDYRSIPKVNIHRIALSFLGKYIFNKGIAKEKLNGLVLTISRMISLTFGRFYFPDVYKIEHKNILEYLKDFERFDIIVASIFPFSDADLAYAIKNKYFPKAKIVLDIGDPLFKNAARNNIGNSKLLNYEKSVVSKSDAIIVTNEATKEYYCDFDFPKNRIHVIPQGVNIDKFSSPNNRKSEEQLTMIYAGVFYKNLRDPSTFVKAINTLDKKNISINMFGIGQDLEFECHNTTVNNYPRIAQMELVSKYRESDILLYFDNAFGIQSSGKIFELLALKKPILFIYSNENSSVRKDSEKYKSIIFVKNELKELVNILSRLESLIEDLSFDYKTESFSWQNRANNFKEVFTSLQF
jgi:hypothetical protein